VTKRNCRVQPAPLAAQWGVATHDLSILLFAATLALAPPAADVYRFALADCDDVVFGPEGDLYFACHSPTDALGVKVRGAKSAPDIMDAYVLRVRPRNGEIVYASRIGGSSFDAALRIAVDRNGFAYATGLTKSRDFPVTSGGLLRGDSDAFLAKISSTGEVIYSATFGGSGDEIGNALAIGEDGSVYLGGSSSSPDLAPASDMSDFSTGDDAFVCRVPSPRGTAQCVRFGGSKTEKLTGLALDGRGGIYAVGFTSSADFPMRRQVQERLRGSSDLFLTRLAIPTLKMTFSTLFGGSGADSGWGIAIDKRGNPIVAGITDSEDLPGTTASYQPQNRGQRDAFLALFGNLDHRNIRATYFGGSLDDESGYDGGNVKVGPDGKVWLAGITHSKNLPMRNAIQREYGGGDGDGFVAAFSPDLTRLCFASFFGDRDRNLLEGLAVSSNAIAATGVSFKNSPAAFHVRVGPSLYAGHNAVLLNGESKCEQ
jgi:hypothetical protein